MQYLSALPVQTITTQEPQGVLMETSTAFAQNPVRAFMGLHRRTFITNTVGSGNDRSDQVGIWIKGFYQNVGESIPIYLGGEGYQSQDYKMIIDKDGNVGLGKSVPYYLLDMEKNTPTGAVAALRNPAAGQNAWAEFRASNDQYDYLSSGVYSSQTNIYGAMQPRSAYSYSSSPTGMAIMADHVNGNIRFATGGNTERMRVAENGNVGIGTINPQSKLAVNGEIRSTKVKVTQSGWPDFVFSPEYVLPRLSELEKFILREKHLPDVPSEADVKSNGLDLGDNQATLLRKVEELTLYLIQQNKIIEKQQVEIETIKHQLKVKTK